MTPDPILAAVAALSLAYAFVAAALHKWRHRARFAEILENYRLLPRPALRPTAWLLPGLEFLTGVLLLVCSFSPPLFAVAAASCAIALLCMYTLAIGVNLARGRRSIDCGCGAPDLKQTIGVGLLLRNGVLIFCAALLLHPATPRAAGWLDWTVILPATAVCCLLYESVNRLLANRETLRPLSRRPRPLLHTKESRHA